MLKNRRKRYFYESVTDGRTDGRMDGATDQWMERRMEQRMDQRTNGRTDTPSYRVACTRLKKSGIILKEARKNYFYFTEICTGPSRIAFNEAAA